MPEYTRNSVNRSESNKIRKMMKDYTAAQIANELMVSVACVKRNIEHFSKSKDEVQAARKKREAAKKAAVTKAKNKQAKEAAEEAAKALAEQEAAE